MTQDRNDHGFPEIRSQDEIDGEDLEFSDWGRSERFPSGWWRGPVLIVSLMAAVAALKWLAVTVSG